MHFPIAKAMTTHQRNQLDKTGLLPGPAARTAFSRSIGQKRDEPRNPIWLVLGLLLLYGVAEGIAHDWESKSREVQKLGGAK